MTVTRAGHVLLVARRDPQDPIRRILKEAGYAVVPADGAAAAIRAAGRSRPAAIVADPRALTPSGRDELRSFATANQVPIVLDWPDPTALLAELELLLGGQEASGEDRADLAVGPLRIDIAGHVAYLDERSLDLTAREFDLLSHFARHPGWVWSRQELIEQVWGYDYGDPRVVTVHMGNLRKKLDAAAPGMTLIETVRNIGYKLVVPVSAAPVPTPSAPSEPAAGAETPESAGATPPAEAAQFVDERRLVTILVAHLGGLTALVEGRESLRSLLGALAAVVKPCVERYGGGVHRFSADSAVALFGAPAAHDNDAERAVRAALDLVSAVSGFAAERGDAELSACVGINTGMVVAGWVEGVAAEQYSVVGDAVELASRLAALAAPGEVILSPETLRVAGSVVKAEPSGTVRVSGKLDEVAYYLVTRVAPGREAGERSSAMDSPLVNREDELALFRGCLDRLEEGIGSVVFVTGEAGVGKSRLTAEMRRTAETRKVKWLEGRALSHGQTMTYLPLVEIIQADCAIETDDPDSVREAKLRERVERLFADQSGEIMPVLANLLGLSLGAAAEAQLFRPDEEHRRRLVVDTLKRYVSRLGTEQPVVIVLEDVHWLDSSSADLVADLLPLTASAPVAISLKGRKDPESRTAELLERAKSCEEVRCLELELRPLSEKQTGQLIRNLLQESDLDAAIVSAVGRRSEGNPFFVEEILRHLMDTGSLSRDARGHWRAVATQVSTVVPNTLQGVIRARIDQLPAGPREELLRASVIGRSFYHVLLRAIAPGDAADLERNLDYLGDRRLIVLKQREPELEYAFKHALVQDAAYDSILPKQRKELHREVARTIERTFPGRLKDLNGILAYHYTKAEDWDKAQDYLLKAGDHSISMAADREAVAYYREAMAALLRAFDESADVSESHDRVRWFVQRTEAFWLAHCLGDMIEPVRVFYDKVLKSCGPADPRTIAATTMLAGCYFQKGLHTDTAELVQRALSALERSGAENDTSQTRLLLLLGLAQMRLDLLAQAEATLTKALALESQKAGPDERLLEDLHIFLSSAHSLCGHLEDGRRLAEEAIRTLPLDGTQRYWMLRINLAACSQYCGEWEEAAAQARECVEGVSNPFVRAVAVRTLGEIRHAQGAYLEAEEHLTGAVATLADLGYPDPAISSDPAVTVLTELAETQLQTGKIDKAEQTAQRTLDLITRGPEPESSDAARAYTTMAGVEMARGRIDTARPLLDRGIRLAATKHSARDPFRAELEFRNAELLRMEGHRDEAQASFEQSIHLLAKLRGERAGEHPRVAQLKARWEAGIPSNHGRTHAVVMTRKKRGSQ